MNFPFAAILIGFCLSFGLSRANSGEQILFAFDDHSIPWQHNLKLTLVQAQKHAQNPVVRRGAKGTPDDAHAVLYGTVIKDGAKFRMWYLGMHETQANETPPADSWRPMCYAESTDGVNWTKPELGLVELNGNKRNNICLIEGQPFSLTRINDFLSVLFDPEDPDPARRYKSAYIAHVPYEEIRGGLSNVGKKEKTPCVSICATSADGFSWKVVGDRPVDAEGERFEVTSVYRFGNFYYSTGQLLPPWAWRTDGTGVGRVMMAYRSPDFVTWSKLKALSFARPGQLMNPPVAGLQTHMGAGLWNRGNVLVGLYGMWQDGPKEKPAGADRLWGTHIDLGLVVSNDGIHFREPVTDFKVIARGSEGEWDNVALLQGHAFANVGDQTMIWYSHWDTAGPTDKMEIGLATLRLDGFGYLSRQEESESGQFLTTTVERRPQGRRLLINAEGLAPESPLTVELLDEYDRPIPGFSEKEAARLSESGTQLEVTWPKSKNNRLPVNRTFAVQVGFPSTGQTRVYALYVLE